MSVQPQETMIYFGDITSKSLQLADDFVYDPSDLDNTDKHFERIIEGLANTPIPDRVNDLVDPNAFDESLVRYKKNPILRRNHKADEVIGRVIKIEPRPEGLWIQARIFKGVDEAEKAWKLILQGGLQAFSVYGVIKEKQQKQQLDGKMVQHVTQFDLQEIAIVDIPANPDSLFRIVAKSVDNMANETEKANELNPAEPVTNNEPKKEIGNEAISTDSTVEKMLTQIASFQQKTLEVLVTLAESNDSIVEKIGELGQEMVAKNAEDEFADEELEDDEFADEEEFKSAPAGEKDLAKRLENLIDKHSIRGETATKLVASLHEDNKVLQKQVEELKASKTAEVENKPPAEKEEVRDADLEEVVRKAASKVSTETSEKEEETENESPLRSMIVQKLMN